MMIWRTCAACEAGTGAERFASLTQANRRQIYAVLALYSNWLPPDEPLVRVDEKSIQFLAHSRKPLPMRPACSIRQSREYRRGGTRNTFVAIEQLAGQRTVAVTRRLA
jgi:hypothetical protein